MRKLAFGLVVYFVAWTLLIASFWTMPYNYSHAVNTIRFIFGIALMRPALNAFFATIYWLLPRGSPRDRMFRRSTLRNRPLKRPRRLPETSLWDHFGRHGDDSIEASGTVRAK